MSLLAPFWSLTAWLSKRGKENVMTTTPFAICVGHSRKVNSRPEGGAVSVGNVSEWTYNVELAKMIADHLTDAGIPSVIVQEYEGNGYSAAQRWLAARLRALGAIGAIEVHFNSSDGESANGQEMLYWHSSTKGRALADSLGVELSLAVPELRNRGLKPKTRSDRGAEFLSGTHCPAVIVETGFGSSPHDWGVMVAKKREIAEALAEGIKDWMP
jgi:N-acetylmuramoyl-L-alanine amidase